MQRQQFQQQNLQRQQMMQRQQMQQQNIQRQMQHVSRCNAATPAVPRSATAVSGSPATIQGAATAVSRTSCSAISPGAGLQGQALTDTNWKGPRPGALFVWETWPYCLYFPVIQCRFTSEYLKKLRGIGGVYAFFPKVAFHRACRVGLLPALLGSAGAQQQQQQQARYAFVIGNDDYEGAQLPSAATMQA